MNSEWTAFMCGVLIALTVTLFVSYTMIRDFLGGHDIAQVMNMIQRCKEFKCFDRFLTMVSNYSATPYYHIDELYIKGNVSDYLE